MYKIVPINGSIDPIAIRDTEIDRSLTVDGKSTTGKDIGKEETVMESGEEGVNLVIIGVEGISREGDHMEVIKVTIMVIFRIGSGGKIMEQQEEVIMLEMDR